MIEQCEVCLRPRYSGETVGADVCGVNRYNCYKIGYERLQKQLEDKYALSVEGRWTKLGEILMTDCGYVDRYAGDPSKWPLNCCVGCAANALGQLNENS